MNQPLISVLVPAYNAERWLEDCCQSVFEQTWSNWELVIVDDGSRDGTLALAQALAHGRDNVHVIHTENGGVCQARNKALEAASGAFISFLDADDMLLPDALEWLYSLLSKKGADIAVGQKTFVRANGDPAHRNTYPEKEVFWTGTEGLIKSLEDHPATYSVWGKLYRRSLVEDVRFVVGRRVHEDSFFVFQCLMKQPSVAVEDRVIIRYRLSENSASRSAFSDKFFDMLAFAEDKKALIHDQYPELEDVAGNLWVKANMALLQNLCKTTDPKYRQAEKDCIQAIRDNRAFFVPATSANEKWFWIVTHGLYPVYKRYYRLRSK